MRKPFVLGVDGYISGPVHELLAQADVVVASDASTVGPPSTIMPHVGSHTVRELPHQELARLLLLQSAGAMSVERGQQLGLIDHIVTSGRLEAATMECAQRLVVD
jgi:enoyl-CoA hydratase/carnithine racemase